MIAIDTMFYCPDDNFSFELNGTISGETANLIKFKVEPCNQKILEMNNPGLNKKCKPKSDVLPYIKDLYVQVAILTQYFN
jgi:hypothetical protein